MTTPRNSETSAQRTSFNTSRWLSKLATFWKNCGEFWLRIHLWYQVLHAARACFLISLVVPLLFICVAQGRDTLRLVASQGVSWHGFWTIAGMFVAGFASWGWARFLLNCEFPASMEVSQLSKNEKELEKKLEQGRKIFRRVCGLLPPVGMALGFLVAADNSGYIAECMVFAALSAGVAVALWCSYEPLNRWHEKLNENAQGTGQRVYRFKNFDDVKSDKFAMRAISTALGLSVLVSVVLTLWPVRFGQALGSPAVVLFAVAVWIAISSLIFYLLRPYRVPVLTVAFFWALFCSLFNDNHHVRVLPPTAARNASMEIASALRLWHEQVSKEYPLKNTNQPRPLYLVASAGGGVRAAYWTAIVLGALEDCARSNGTSFAAHTFALSGVSGGSLGEITFAGLLAHSRAEQGSLMDHGSNLLGCDFLAADLAKMAFADLLQQFCPIPIRFFDRARSLEDAWAAAWKADFHTNASVLNESLAQLYLDASNANVILPHLLLNGTCVETGQRIITSDLAIRSRIKALGRRNSNGRFLDVISADEKLKNAPIRLSTAAHQSARFTYFSPAGRFPDGTHVVDGGYFENSGASTLMDALSMIQWSIKSNHWTDVEPRIILIDNEPIPLEAKRHSVTIVANLISSVLNKLLCEELAPVRTLLNTRTARGDYAVEQALVYDWKATNICQFVLYERDEKQSLGLCKEPGKLPLGWTLSQSAKNEMIAQLTLPFPQEGSNSVNNPAKISKIIAALPRSTLCDTNSAMGAGASPVSIAGR